MEAEGGGQPEKEMHVQAQPPSSSEEEIQGTSSNNTGNSNQPAQTRRGGRGVRRTTAAAAARPTPRRTRSQAAPQWTVAETLVLVDAIAALDEVWLKALSSYQRWNMISDNCVSMNVVRSSNQCKRRWDCLLSEYKKISSWESNDACTSGSYWSLQPATRRRLRLPASFDKEVFGSMDAVISAQYPQDDSHCLVATPEDTGQVEEIIDMLDAEMADADEDDSGSEETGTETIERTNKEPEMANKLHENTEDIHAILRGELGPVDLKPNVTATEFARRQAEELIKSFGVLVGTLDHFTELINNGECDGSSLMNSMAP